MNDRIQNTGITGLILAILMLLPLFSTAQTLTYREESGDNIYHYDYEIDQTDNGVNIQVIRREGNTVLENQTFFLGKDLKTKKWTFIRPADETQVTATINGDEVVLKGTRDGKIIEEQEDLDGYPWIQLWPMNIGLENFIISDEEEIKYWAYGTEKPGDLELAKFVATKDGTELIQVGDEKHQAYRINITLSGWRSMFWEGDFFFREKDLRIIMYEGEGAPGKPDSRTTLITED